MIARTAIAVLALTLAACTPPNQGAAAMSDARQHHSINYIELPLAEVDATKAFYSQAFGWSFQDYGPGYVAFSGAAVDGGFNAEATASPEGNGVLVVLYSNDLEATRDTVAAAGARISKDIYSFPGGRRFHFIDPNGNELAVWSE
jgi:predicted enzyme related to lactoylglutathione lyase